MLTQPFLTDLDTRAQVKGSVDPLGAMAVWTRLGRRVVGNLSTVTTSVRDFKTLVLGFGLISDLRRKGGPDHDLNELSAFLRWEQLAAYTRASSGDWGFRGLRRVKSRMSEGQVVPVSAERDCQILGNQKVYGLWGLFTVPSRASGLLEREVNELTQVADDFVNQNWKRTLTPIWDGLLKAMAEDSRRFNLERHDALVKRLRTVWSKLTDADRPFWRHHLVDGGPTDKTGGEQTALASLLRKTLKDDAFAFSQQSVRKLARQAAGADEQLAQHLLDIAACESVLAYADVLFGYLQTLDAQPATKAVDAVRRAWPKKLAMVDRERFATLRPDLAAATGNPRIASAWLELSEDLGTGVWGDAVSRLLLINKLVMEGRGGAAWVADEGGTLRVRYRDEVASLPLAGELDGLWRYPYFIGSLRSVIQELEAA